MAPQYPSGQEREDVNIRKVELIREVMDRALWRDVIAKVS